jgi:mono/diheme cytochrome c family protein
MGRRIMVILGLAFPLGIAQASAAPATNAPDPEYGKKLAADLCSNCHLVGTGDQQQANADSPSFREIANKEGQSAGSIIAHIVVPKSDAVDSADPGRACRSRRLYLDAARVEVTPAANCIDGQRTLMPMIG